MNFVLEAQDGQARAGFFETAHGRVEFPAFMPVGTRGSVKTMWREHLEELDPQVILGNTYHLYLKPGHELIADLGGLHQFTGWKGPMLTDSGGFQVFSLKELTKVTDLGVHFQSHIDGSRHFFSPEKSMEIQKALGADIVMCFDECPPLPCSEQQLKKAVERSLSWAQSCRNYSLQEHQYLFGIVQGGLDLKLRQECLQELKKMDFAGYALGGLSVGEKNQQMQALLQEFTPELPADQPRYLMGVGKPLDILQAVKCGIDLFDCVLPTRNGRNGQALTSLGALNMKNQQYMRDNRPLDERCVCRSCQGYSRAYIRHLLTVGEPLGGMLVTYHNLAFYLKMMREARDAIKARNFDDYYMKFYKDYTQINS